ncbi:MAG: glycosyltransferase [Chthoniobacteraceae bacterium]
MSDSGDLFIVIPAYRESERLPGFLRSVCRTLSASSYRYAILVVDDGSGPEEQARLSEVVAGLQKETPGLLPPLLLPENHGKGYAIREGWNRGTGYNWLAFVDADGATSAGELLRLCELAQLAEPHGAVFASRIKMLGRTVTRSASRHVLGRVFATLVGMAICPAIYDSQCGCKIIPGRAWPLISGEMQEEGFAFDVELLGLLLKRGVPVREEPVNWFDQPGSRVHPIRDSIRMAKAVRRIRKRLGKAPGL